MAACSSSTALVYVYALLWCAWSVGAQTSEGCDGAAKCEEDRSNVRANTLIQRSVQSTQVAALSEQKKSGGFWDDFKKTTGLDTLDKASDHIPECQEAKDLEREIETAEGKIDQYIESKDNLRDSMAEVEAWLDGNRCLKKPIVEEIEQDNPYAGPCLGDSAEQMVSQYKVCEVSDFASDSGVQILNFAFGRNIDERTCMLPAAEQCSTGRFIFFPWLPPATGAVQSSMLQSENLTDLSAYLNFDGLSEGRPPSLTEEGRVRLSEHGVDVDAVLAEMDAFGRQPGGWDMSGYNDPTPPTTPLPTAAQVITKVIYSEGTAPKTNNGGTISVVPGVSYTVSMEILRNDLGHSSERVTDVTFDGTSIGGCNPDGGDYDCTFFTCPQSPTVSSSTGSIAVNLEYSGHSYDCDCDKSTWDCSKERTVSGRAKMTAVARFTLVPIEPTPTPTVDQQNLNNQIQGQWWLKLRGWQRYFSMCLCCKSHSQQFLPMFAHEEIAPTIYNAPVVKEATNLAACEEECVSEESCASFGYSTVENKCVMNRGLTSKNNADWHCKNVMRMQSVVPMGEGSCDGYSWDDAYTFPDLEACYDTCKGSSSCHYVLHQGTNPYQCWLGRSNSCQPEALYKPMSGAEGGHLVSRSGSLVKIYADCGDDAADEVLRKEEELNSMMSQLDNIKYNVEYERRYIKHLEDELGDNLCHFIKDGLASFFNVVAGLMCEIVQVLILAASCALNSFFKAIPGIGNLLLALQALPHCLTVNLPVAGDVAIANFLTGVALWLFKLLICKIKDIQPVANILKDNDAFKPLLVSWESSKCHVGQAAQSTLGFIMALSCGQVGSAIMSFARPAIMCNIKNPLTGEACQSEGCIFGGDRSLLAISNGTAW